MVAIEGLNVYNAAPSGIIAANEDIFNGSPATDVLSMAIYQDILFIITKNAGATGTATLTVESCDNTTPSNTTTIAFRSQVTTTGNVASAWEARAAAGFDTTAGANQVYVIWVRAKDLDNGDQFVRLVATEVANNPVDGAIIAIGLNPRYEFDGVVDITS